MDSLLTLFLITDKHWWLFAFGIPDFVWAPFHSCVSVATCTQLQGVEIPTSWQANSPLEIVVVCSFPLALLSIITFETLETNKLWNEHLRYSSVASDSHISSNISPFSLACYITQAAILAKRSIDQLPVMFALINPAKCQELLVGVQAIKHSYHLTGRDFNKGN